MAGSTPPRGLIADLVTPLGPNGSVDRPGLERVLDRVLPHADGVLLCGPDAGEGSELGQAQRLDALQCAAKSVGGRLPLMVWITSRTQDETGSMLEVLEKGMEREGYEGPLFWVDTPLVYHSNRGLPQHLKDLAAFASRPLILFNDPERVKRSARPLKRANLRTAILKEAAHVEAVCGLVFRGPLDRARNYQKAVRFRSGFRVYDGDEAQFLTHPSRHGVLSPGAVLAPSAWHRVTASSLGTGGDARNAPGHLARIWELGRYLETLRAVYAEEPARTIRGALERIGLLEGLSDASSDASLEKALQQLHEIMKAQGDA